MRLSKLFAMSRCPSTHYVSQVMSSTQLTTSNKSLKHELSCDIDGFHTKLWISLFKNVDFGGQKYYNYRNIPKIAKITSNWTSIHARFLNTLWSNRDINFFFYLSEVDKFGHYFVHNVWIKHNVTCFVGNLIKQVTDLTLNWVFHKLSTTWSWHFWQPLLLFSFLCYIYPGHLYRFGENTT